MIRIKYASVAAAAMLLAQPCLAQADFRSDGAFEKRSGAFAGARVRVPLGGGSKAEKPSARLQLTAFHDYRSASGATVRTFRPDGLELGVKKKGGLSLRVAGQDVDNQKKRLGLSGSTGTLVVIGVTVVALIVLIPIITADSYGIPDFNDTD